MSLFSALYAYRPRVRESGKQDREPLEDWLTECLAECLRAIVREDFEAASAVLAELSGCDLLQVSKALRERKLLIETQIVSGGDGRPDLVVWLDGWPWIVAENKVNHSATFDQLARYARWQASYVAEKATNMGLLPVILFVTQNTPAPEQIRNGAQPFASARSMVTKWSRIAKMICAATDDWARDSHARTLAKAFHHFLWEQDMANEYPSTQAMAAAELFLHTSGDVLRLADEMLLRAESLGNFFKMTTYGAKPFPAKGLIYASRWATSIIGDTGGNVCTGLFFPAIGSYRGDLQESLDIEITDFPKVFVSIDGQDLMAAKDGSPSNWHRDSDEHVVFKDFATFVGSSDVRGGEILAWTEMVCQEFQEWAKAAD